jgi:hypothetical protein
MKRWWVTKQDVRNDLAAAQLEVRLLAERLHHLTNADPYKSGFHDGVAVGIQQLRKWLDACQESAKQVIEASPVDHDNPDFKQGHDLASAWITECIDQLDDAILGRVEADEQQAEVTHDPR